ncbi:MAG TPA: hypothetical protein PKD85_15575, partial [Saprospiraceae bacterium]|nr:hypothetical protein [Saprospiraceae bacterium]
STIIAEQDFISHPAFIEWEPKVNFENNKTYFWRIINIKNKIISKVTSFVVNNNNYEGIEIIDFNIFKNSISDFLITDNGFFQYKKVTRTIEISNGLSSFGAGQLVGYRVDNSDFAATVRPWTFVNQGIGIAILDTIIGTHKINTKEPFFGISSSAQGASRSFGFNTNTVEERKILVDFIENHIPIGHHVSIMTILNNVNSKLNLADWEADSLVYGTSLPKVLRKYGALLIDKLISEEKDLPYTFMFQKGLKVHDEVLANNKLDIINSKMTFPYSFTEGQMIIENISTSELWGQIKIAYENSENNESKLLIFNSKDQLCLDTLLQSELKEVIDLSKIDPAIHNNLKILILDKNLVSRSAIQIKSIYISFKRAPEIILKPIKYFFTSTIEQGMPLKYIIEPILIYNENLKNVSIFQEEKSNSNEILVKTIEIANLGNNKNDQIELSLDTKKYIGQIRFRVEINQNKKFIEHNYMNNSGISYINLTKDVFAPSISVNSNNSPLVSGSVLPRDNKFVVNLSDNNKYLELKDQKLLSVKILDQKGDEIFYSNRDQVIKKNIFTDKENTLQLIFDLELKDGKYSLVALGKDATGNLSGENLFEVGFEVISEKAIKNLYTYPNPFSNSTKFIYTVTGEIPASALIQIF